MVDNMRLITVRSLRRCKLRALFPEYSRGGTGYIGVNVKNATMNKIVQWQEDKQL